MADVLTHVLVGYIVGTVLSIRDDRLTSSDVTMVMIGALSPDFAKIGLIVPSETVGSVVGFPFEWGALHTLGGTVVVVCLGSLLVAPDYRRRAVVLLSIGALTHHVLDVALLTVTGYAYPVFWPLTEYHLPAGNLYTSSDRWPAVVSGALAVVLWRVRRRPDTGSTPE